jgi:threonine dehydratase
VASASKVEKIRSFGATLTITGDRYANALAASEQWAEQSGALQVHAFDQIETLLGQGTVGLEFEQQVAEVDTLLVAVGGGGLIGGIAAWFAERIERNAMKIVGVEPETAPTLTLALRAGHPVDAPAEGIAADSLAPGRVGEIMFPLAQNYVSDVLLASDDSIEDAKQSLWSNLRIAAEPGGAAAFAALLSGLYSPKANERVGIIISGGNTSAIDFSGTPALRVKLGDGCTDCMEKE